MNWRGWLALALAFAPLRRERSNASACPVCMNEERAPDGECMTCGVYKCSTCARLHLGNPLNPCPGDGVLDPRDAREGEAA